MSELHISISAQPIFVWGNYQVTNTMLVTVLVTLFLSLLAINAQRFLSRKHPPRWVLFLQTLVESFYEYVQSITPRHAARFFPLVATLFLFILFGNWAGLLPGAESIGLKTSHGFVPFLRGATADINTTLALAIFAVFSVQFYGYKFRGLRYFTKFFDLSNPINFFVGFLELISEFSKIMSFTFRLFGNIFAGEVLLAVIAFLVPLFASLPFLGLEIFVGLIQALVFSTLTLVFINIATAEHH
ncbi:ATP synthase F0 subunit A [Candidatus Beckwithbacteria bacterium CG_4_10_14_0_2_um_filter_47_25]|uniref:ATP synthase subunit a n=3 Tax=Candidatus Beckwithiibacteriota TaxID=1752726 RepID=A0A1J4RQ20_9BACT|nr:MAG: ATP synthase F0 subunit A [Candidatus Beckwithbacteria bacterium CG1_02_47_37]PIP52634.1 MAG: ATP synthase F0 subunit A [Candidatus Beckwithbacteria bacterium CG23_combo_of_CG06-09_8_20_14_all_47_9]PJA22933.1 MAG: ATP synthase F0 subunit A [Candidatus Beckwithbacteria bacterium CG_4_10_14_0_2_um_filter_47_25]